ncbi:MAG: hypothetical protein KME43_22100 [Myxacorys chilensis ATA2-1-KO14]|nr:hypothetical protein [Myxacorys chilensis ATA2-1-KO14]
MRGIWTSDRTRADGKYFILANEGKSFILSDNKGGVYKSEQQILIERMSASLGNSATTQLTTITFTDEEITPKLSELAATQPNALILLSGSLAVDLPKNIRVPIIANQFQTAKLADKTITPTFHPLELTLQHLAEQYCTGTLTAKIIAPRPQ